MYNYIIYNEYPFPTKSDTHLLGYTQLYRTPNTLPSNNSYSDVSLVEKNILIDGNEGNTRRVSISVSAPLGGDVPFIVTGIIFNGTTVTEVLTLPGTDTQVISANFYYSITSIYRYNNLFSALLAVGYSDEGYTPIALSNGSKSDHFITWTSGTATVTVYGSMSPFMNQDTTLEQLKFYPLSSTLTGFTTTMTAPEYYLQPAGFFRAYVASGSTAGITYRVSLQSLFN